MIVMGIASRGIIIPSLYVATSCVCLNLFRRVSYHHHPHHLDFNHVPVARREVVDWLVTDSNGTYVDCTLGGGGHSLALLEKLDPEGVVVGLDIDQDALNAAGRRLSSYQDRNCFIPVKSNFANCGPAVRNALSSLGHVKANQNQIGIVDGILLDLGISSHQIDTGSRGFSFMTDGPLDMRMDGLSSVSTAADICNTLGEEDLRDLFFKLGGERRSRKIARAVIAARPLSRTSQLADAVASVVPRMEVYKSQARVFQALRIKVNDELSSLVSALFHAEGLVRPGGRIAVLSYHSLEDRRVKRILNKGNLQGIEVKDLYGKKLAPWRPLTRKPILPATQEVEANPRSRSAKLRVAERTSLKSRPSLDYGLHPSMWKGRV
eukprot:65789_1